MSKWKEPTGRISAALMFGMRMFGWTGNILNVDLTEGRIWREKVPVELLHAYLGGRGLGARYMREQFRLDPLCADIPLSFAVGPLCGTGAPATSRLTVTARSPLTGTVCHSSMGGFFASQLKAAGMDVLRVLGESRRPAVLAIAGERAELLCADDLWGRGVTETISSLSKRGSVAAIGPAGENAVPYACIMGSGGHAAGRGGLGAVMGKKKLKAVVVSGGERTRIAHGERFVRACDDVMRLLRASPVIFGEFGIAAYGTSAFVDLTRQRRMTPTENFRRTLFDGSAAYSGPALRRAFRIENDGCHGCPVCCRKKGPDGLAIPGYETLSHFGALNGIADIHAIVNANTACNDLGLDTISAAATMAAWGEWRGRFAGAQELVPLLHDIAQRRGDGELLALGSRRLTEEVGAPELSMSVKSLELPAYDPRGVYGMALGYCTGNRGGCHLDAFALSHEILRKPVATDRFSFSGKARIIKIGEDLNAAADSLVVCRFPLLGASMEEYAELLSAATGLPYNAGALSEAGERIWLTERFYNCANGFTAGDDRLPERFHSEPGSSGEGIDIPPLDRTRLREELGKYYRIRGLTAEGTFADGEYLARLP